MLTSDLASLASSKRPISAAFKAEDITDSAAWPGSGHANGFPGEAMQPFLTKDSAAPALRPAGKLGGGCWTDVVGDSED